MRRIIKDPCTKIVKKLNKGTRTTATAAVAAKGSHGGNTGFPAKLAAAAAQGERDC